MNQNFTAVIHPAEEGGYWGYVLEDPGGFGQGATLDELRENLKDGLALMLADMREDAQKEEGATLEVLQIAV